MAPDEIIEGLRKLGVDPPPSRDTILNWEKWGLIPKAKRGSLGRGKGRFTDYPDEALAEAHATYKLLRSSPRITAADVKKARDAVLKGEIDKGRWRLQFEDDRITHGVINALEWLSNTILDPEEYVEVYFKGDAKPPKLVVTFEIKQGMPVPNLKVLRQLGGPRYFIGNEGWMELPPKEE